MDDLNAWVYDMMGREESDWGPIVEEREDGPQAYVDVVAQNPSALVSRMYLRS